MSLSQIQDESVPELVSGTSRNLIGESSTLNRLSDPQLEVLDSVSPTRPQLENVSTHFLNQKLGTDLISDYGTNQAPNSSQEHVPRRHGAQKELPLRRKYKSSSDIKSSRLENENVFVDILKQSKLDLISLQHKIVSQEERWAKFSKSHDKRMKCITITRTIILILIVFAIYFVVMIFKPSQDLHKLDYIVYVNSTNQTVIRVS